VADIASSVSSNDNKGALLACRIVFASDKKQIGPESSFYTPLLNRAGSQSKIQNFDNSDGYFGPARRQVVGTAKVADIRL
jgi:hypothetical protein